MTQHVIMSGWCIKVCFNCVIFHIFSYTKPRMELSCPNTDGNKEGEKTPTFRWSQSSHNKWDVERDLSAPLRIYITCCRPAHIQNKAVSSLPSLIVIKTRRNVGRGKSGAAGCSHRSCWSHPSPAAMTTHVDVQACHFFVYLLCER